MSVTQREKLYDLKTKQLKKKMSYPEAETVSGATGTRLPS